MDEAKDVIVLQDFDPADATPISDLSPHLPNLQSKAVRGVVTITWPYNSVKGTFAFNLAEPDFRRRKNKGQVRITFIGRAAKVAGGCGLGSNDEVLLALDGAAWEPEDTNRRQSLPGSELAWKIVFSDSFSLRITRVDDDNVGVVTLTKGSAPTAEAIPDANPCPTNPTSPYRSPTLPPTTLEASEPTRVSATLGLGAQRLHDGEFASPAFIKRARMSYGSLFEGDFDLFEDDGGVRGKGRKRTRFGRESGAWRYSSQSPSPEPPAVTSKDVEANEVYEALPPPRVETTDEGCQTMEVDVAINGPAAVTTQIQSCDHSTPTGHTVMAYENEATLKMTPELQEFAGAFVEPAADTESHRMSSETWPPAFPALVIEPAIDSKTPPPNFEAPLEHPNSGLEHTVENSSGENHHSEDSHVISRIFGNPPMQNVHLPLDQPFPSSAFGTPTAGGLDLSLNAPVEPDVNVTIEPEVDDSGYSQHREATEAAPVHYMEPDTGVGAYHPLSDAENVGATHVHDEALANYPTNYLDDGNVPQDTATMDISMEMNYPVPTETATSAWVTVNNNSEAASAPVGSRFASSDGSTQDQALVIDDSDSDKDSAPAPTAVEDTVQRGHADALDLYEDAEVEDEEDAQYSDEDEPEYDADEMGGDYDTRNYQYPNDDEDDIQDEDLQPRHLEPEFDDGESLDEDEDEDEDLRVAHPEQEFEDGEQFEEDEEGEFEEDEEGEFDEAGEEGEYDEEDEEEEYDEEVEEAVEDRYNASLRNTFQPPQPTMHLTPMVIDLVSSSDESGDEDGEVSTEAYQSGVPVVAHTPTAPQRNASRSTAGEDSDYGHDEQVESEHSELHDASKMGEDSVQQIAHADSQEQGGVAKGEEASPAEDVDEDDELEPAVDDLPEAEGLTDASEDGGERQSASETDSADDTAAQQDVEILQITRSPSHQTSHQEELHPAAGGEEESKDLPGNNTILAPMSAAEGLDALSRILENEPSNVEHSAPAESIEKHDVGGQDASMKQQSDEALLPASPHVLTDTPHEVSDDEDEDEDEDKDEDKDEVSLIAPVAAIAEHQSSFATEKPRQETAPAGAALSSPPLTQSFQSVVHESLLFTSQDNTFAPQAGIATDQLPTPLESQVTGTLAAGDAHTTTHITVEEVDEMLQQEITVEMDTNIESARRKQSPPGYPLDGSSEVPSIMQSFHSNMDVDDELQASVLEYSQFDGASDDRDEQLSSSRGIETSSRDVQSDQEQEDDVPSPRAHEPASPYNLRKISTQLRRNFVEEEEEGGHSTQDDPSVHLARAANVAKGSAKAHDSPTTRTLDGRRSPTPEAEDASVRLARASLASQPPKPEEDSTSMAIVKLDLGRHLRDKLPDCTSLKVLRQHLTKSLDVIAVALMQPPAPRQAKSGPREFMMSFTVTDQSIGPHAVAEVLLYRPHKDFLPVVKYGDVVLLRNFTVVSLTGKGFGLKTNDASSWAVFDQEDQPAQIRGPPVEYGDSETTYVTYLREWFDLLDDKAKEKLERANQKIVEAGKPKKN